MVTLSVPSDPPTLEPNITIVSATEYLNPGSTMVISIIAPLPSLSISNDAPTPLPEVVPVTFVKVAAAPTDVPEDVTVSTFPPPPINEPGISN